MSGTSRPGVAELRLRSAVRWGLSPLLVAWTAGCVAYGPAHPEALTVVLAVKAG